MSWLFIDNSALSVSIGGALQESYLDYFIIFYSRLASGYGGSIFLLSGWRLDASLSSNSKSGMSALGVCWVALFYIPPLTNSCISFMSPFSSGLDEWKSFFSLISSFEFAFGFLLTPWDMPEMFSSLLTSVYFQWTLSLVFLSSNFQHLIECLSHLFPYITAWHLKHILSLWT